MILIGGGYVAKERKEIESGLNQNVSKLQIILISLSFKAEKKKYKSKKRKEKMVHSEKKKLENCDTRTTAHVRSMTL